MPSHHHVSGQYSMLLGSQDAARLPGILARARRLSSFHGLPQAPPRAEAAWQRQVQRVGVGFSAQAGGCCSVGAGAAHGATASAPSSASVGTGRAQGAPRSLRMERLRRVRQSVRLGVTKVTKKQEKLRQRLEVTSVLGGGLTLDRTIRHAPKVGWSVERYITHARERLGGRVAMQR